MAYGMSKISHTEPSQHCHITYWTHLEEMKWFSSAMLLGELAANDLGFGLSLAKTCQTFGRSDRRQRHRGMACPKLATQSCFNIVTIFIGLI
jgi:hypothetical protein